jgi:hypothetical protein
VTRPLQEEEQRARHFCLRLTLDVDMTLIVKCYERR